MCSVDVIIPSYNGRKLLERCLPAVIEQAAVAQITVVDDASTDGTDEWLTSHFPQVRLVKLSRHSGFPSAINAGALSSTAEYLLFLNNDMIPEDNLLAYPFEHFDDPSVAVVGLRVLRWADRTLDVGRRLRSYADGLIRGAGENDDFPAPSYTFFASGGAMAVRRSVFEELGGFDTIYSPGYVEDADFCYRTWKCGYTVRWEPRCTLLHIGSATFAPAASGIGGLIKKCKVRFYLHRNSFYFYIKNLTSHDWRREYMRSLPSRTARAFLRGDPLFGIALLRVLFKWRHLRELRLEQHCRFVLDDENVFAKLAELTVES